MFLASEVVLRNTSYADLESAAATWCSPGSKAGRGRDDLPAAAQGRAPQRHPRPRDRALHERGLAKLDGHLLQTAPGDEAAALESLVEQGEHGVDKTAVILVGERLATSPGALTAAAQLRLPAPVPELAWVPRRAGRGAVETGCLPNLLRCCSGVA